MEKKWYNVTYRPYAYGVSTLDINSMDRVPDLNEFYLCRLLDGTERVLKFVYLNDMNYPEYAFVDEVNRVYRDVLLVKQNMPSNKEFIDSFHFDEYEGDI